MTYKRLMSDALYADHHSSIACLLDILRLVNDLPVIVAMPTY
jgi:hypothetical protein